MAYKAIYRKWRPMVFEDVVGQSHITETLKNQIINDRVGHAYLFCGTRGTGKTTAAKILARAVNCLNSKDGSPCNECEICKGILDGSIMDVTEIDAASNNGVDSIRDLRDDTKYVTASAKYRIYIIDEVHMLSSSAFNALLKTLEEPPEHVIFILATTEPHQIPQTIISRCQRYDFKRIKPRDIIVRLKQIAYGDGYDITEDAYSLIARLGDGSMRDAISVLERVVSVCSGTIDYDTISETLGIAPLDVEFMAAQALLDGNVGKIFEIIGEVSDEGRNMNVFVDSLITHFRNLLVCKVTDNPKKLLDYSDEEIVRFKSMAEKATYEKISYITDNLIVAKNSAKWVKSVRVVYETAFVKMCVPELDSSNEAVLARVSDIEEKLKDGVVVTKESKVEVKEEKKKTSTEKKSIKLFNPIPKDKLNASNPIVIAAKKWEKTVAVIIRNAPYLAGALANIQITIDNDGIILMYKRGVEEGARNMALNQLSTITNLAVKACGVDMKIKIAYMDEIDDVAIDFWALSDKKEVALQKEEEASDKVPTLDNDPLNDVMARMDDFVDSVDEHDFLEFNREDEKFSQSSLDDEREEFLEDDEF